MRVMLGKYPYFQYKLTDSKGVDPMLPYRSIQNAAKGLWPSGQALINRKEFTEILTQALIDFDKTFGSDYQKGISKKNLEQLFWLFIPQEEGLMSEESFIRAVVALFQPLPPNLHYKSRISVNSLQDPKRAAVCIEYLYDILYNKNLPYFGDILGAESDRELTIKKDEALKSLGYILRLSDPTLDGPDARGINVTISFISFAETNESCEEVVKNIRLLYYNAAHNRLFFYLVGYRGDTKLETDLNWIPAFVKPQIEKKREKDKDKEEEKAWREGLDKFLTRDTTEIVLSYRR